MPLSRRSLLAGLATVAVVPAAQGAVPDIVTVRTEPPLPDWPDWEPLEPDAMVRAEFQITADSLQYLEPAPGYRFRRADAGTIIHEPEPT